PPALPPAPPAPARTSCGRKWRCGRGGEPCSRTAAGSAGPVPGRWGRRWRGPGRSGGRASPACAGWRRPCLRRAGPRGRPPPAAVENGDVAVVGNLVPEPLQVVLVPFLVVGGADGVDPVGAGVELLRHAPDGAALACGVPALEDDHRPLAVVVAGTLQALQTG